MMSQKPLTKMFYIFFISFAFLSFSPLCAQGMEEETTQLEYFLSQPDVNSSQDGLVEEEDSSLGYQHVSLIDVILHSLSASHKVMASKERMIQAKYNVDIAYGNYYPSIDFSYSIARTQKSPGALKDDGAREENKYYEDEVLSLLLSQNIYSGGETQNEIQKLKADYLLAKTNFEKMLEDEVFKAITAYIDVVFSEEALGANQKNITELEAIHDIVKIKYEAGGLSLGEMSSIAASVSNAKSQLSRTRSMYTNALDYFKFVTADALEELKPYEKMVHVEVGNLEELIQNALLHNKILSGYEHEILSKKYNHSKLRSAFKPKVDLQLSAEKILQQENIDFTEDAYVAKLKVHHNLYNGGKDKNSYLKAFSAIQEKVFEKEAETRKVKWRLEKLHASLASLQDNLQNVEAELEATTKMVTSYWESFRSGEQDLHVLLQAQRQLNTAELDWIKSQQDSMKDFFDILHLSGELLPFFGIDAQSDNFLDSAKANFKNQYLFTSGKKAMGPEDTFLAPEPISPLGIDASQKEKEVSAIEKLLLFHEQFLIEDANKFTIVFSGFDNPLEGLKEIARLKIEDTSFLYEFYEDRQIKTNIAFGIFEEEEDAYEALLNTFTQTLPEDYRIEKVGAIQDEFKDFSTLLFVDANKLPKQTIQPLVSFARQDNKVPFVTDREFKQLFLSAPDTYFTINLTTLSSMEAAGELVKTANLERNSFVFGFGEEQKWIKIMVGAYQTYDEAFTALNALEVLKERYMPVIEKIEKKQLLYKRFHSQ